MRLLASSLHPPQAAGMSEAYPQRRLRLWLPTPVPVAVPRRMPLLTAPRPWTCLSSGSGDFALSEWSPSSGGAVVTLPDEFDRRSAAVLLRAARFARSSGERLVLLHRGAGGASLLRTLHRETPGFHFLSVETGTTRAALASAHALAGTPLPGLTEVAVGGDGLAETTTWTAADLPQERQPLSPGDLVLISGGLGGLGCAVARYLARRLGIHPVVLDLADPTAPVALESLGRLRDSGRPFTHVPLDVTDLQGLRSVLRTVTASRPIRAVVHCAGVIEGGRVETLEVPDLDRIVTPKVGGLRAVLSALDPRPLRVVLAFGSIMARAPHPNAGAYALANELLRREVDRWAARAPGPRYLTAEWSVWDGAGVAAETGAVAMARQAGYTPIRLNEGLSAVERLLAWPGPQTSVIVSETPVHVGRQQ